MKKDKNNKKAIIRIYVRGGVIVGVESNKLQKKDVEVHIRDYDNLESAFEELDINKKEQKIYNDKLKYSLF